MRKSPITEKGLTAAIEINDQTNLEDLGSFASSIAGLPLDSLVFLRNYLRFKMDYPGISIGFRGERILDFIQTERNFSIEQGEVLDDTQQPVYQRALSLSDRRYSPFESDGKRLQDGHLLIEYSKADFYMATIDDEITRRFKYIPANHGVVGQILNDALFVDAKDFEAKPEHKYPNAISYDEAHKEYREILEKVQDADFAHEDVAQRAVTSDHHENYNRWYYAAENQGYKSIIERISEALKNKNVVDLGCGDRISSFASFVMRNGARTYLGTDKYNPVAEADEFGKRENIGVLGASIDMAELLQQMDDGSAVVSINGIDDFVIDPGNPSNREYLRFLASQIARVAGDNAVIGVNSDVVFDSMKEFGYSAESLGFPEEFPIKILRKPR